MQEPREQETERDSGAPPRLAGLRDHLLPNEEVRVPVLPLPAKVEIIIVELLFDLLVENTVDPWAAPFCARSARSTRCRT